MLFNLLLTFYGSIFLCSEKKQRDTAPPPEPIPDQVDVRREMMADQRELLGRLGELTRQSATAFAQAIAEARARGLSIADQEAYVKSLWAEEKIPRIVATGLRDHSTSVQVVDPRVAHALVIDYLDRYDPASPLSSYQTPEVDVDEERARDDIQYFPGQTVGILRGYCAGEIWGSFMGEVNTESLARLQSMASGLEEASVIQVAPTELSS